jgi:hypothetical protein
VTGPFDPTKEAPCPFCGRAIPVMDAPWTCPCCGTLNREWNLLASCETCAFGPYYFTCPHCGDEFELALLSGRYVGADGQELPPERRRRLSATGEVQLGELMVGMAPAVKEDQATLRVTLDALSRSEAIRLAAPCPLQGYFVYSAVTDSSGSAWLYAHLIADVSRARESHVGHFALRARAEGVELRVLEFFPEAARFG